MDAALLQTSWPDAFVAVGGTLMITVVLGVAIWQVMASWRARMSIAREDAYRQLAETTASAQTRLADQQQEIVISLATLRDRVGRIEKVLQEVE
jgi:hypothetical protein